MDFKYILIYIYLFEYVVMLILVDRAQYEIHERD